jgi:hypothetical protein
MDHEPTQFLEDLRKAGWRIELLPRRRSLPEPILRRYPWMPEDYRALAESCALVCSPDEKAWLLTEPDFAGTSASDYAWNEWEHQSLEAAGPDEAWKAKIVEFWDDHLPILLSVKSGYAYFAIEKRSLGIVCGEEPEYEEVTPIAPSLAACLRLVAVKDPSLSRFI